MTSSSPSSESPVLSPADSGVAWGRPAVTTADRERIAGHRGCVVWFTGLSASGKTTLARQLDRHLIETGRRSFLLDGDAVRKQLNADLGFSAAEREENLRRFTEIAKLFADAGVIAVVSAISPYEAARQRAQATIGAERFVLVHVATPIEICERRDPKGLYKRARAGAIKEFTGIDSPYEEPRNPDLRVTPEDGPAEQLVGRLERILEQRGLLSL